MEREFERKLDLKLILSVIAVGLMSFVGVVVETAMNVAFPTIMQEFSVETSTVQWVTTGYLLILSIIIPASSFLKRRFKMKQLFVTAISMFIIGTVLGMIAPTFWVLLLGRVIQGVGTGIALPLMYNIVLEQAPLENMGFMMGIAMMVTAVAPAVGPSFGGMIVNAFGWRVIFVCLLPLLVISFLFGIYSIRQSSEIERTAFDGKGYLMLVLCFSSFIFGTSFAGDYGWGSVQVIGLFLVSVVSILLFICHSAKGQKPLIDLKIFSYRTFSLSVVGLILIQFICLGLGFLIPNFSQLVSGENAFVAGCILLPGCILGVVMTPISGKILDRFGAGKPIMAGSIFIIVSTVLFSVFLSSATTIFLAAFYVFFALGQSLSTGNVMTNGLRSLPEQLSSDGNAVFNTFQQLAGAMGTSVVSTIVATSQAKQPDDRKLATLLGSQSAFILLLVFAVLLIGFLAPAVKTRKVADYRQNKEA